MLNRALKGDHRAAATMLKTTKDLGLLDEAQLAEAAIEDFLPKEMLEGVSDATLRDLQKVTRGLIKNARKKPNE
jgi:hypothetical protein